MIPRRKGERFLQGCFKPKNWQKYDGDPTKIIYRSSWELRVMMWLDHNKNVLKWSSEELAIPYISPKDGKTHRYFIDFVVTMATKTGVETHLIEVKPMAQCTVPQPPKRMTPAFGQRLMTYAINQAKWEMAEQYAKKRGWKFTLLTEKDIPGIK
jgi:TnsA endonuclease N terminal